MEPQFIVAVIVVVLLNSLVRHAAGRRVIARQGVFVWLMFGMPFLIGIAGLYLALEAFGSNPLFALAMALPSLVFLGLLVWFVRRLSSSISATRHDQTSNRRWMGRPSTT